jgi:hypothetical protein
MGKTKRRRNPREEGDSFFSFIIYFILNFRDRQLPLHGIVLMQRTIPPFYMFFFTVVVMENGLGSPHNLGP